MVANKVKQTIMLQKKNWFLILSIIFFSIIKIYAIESLDDIQVGGVYHMELYTGDVLEGIVEEKNDTSLIIESKGQPYIFKGIIIKNYKLISPPKKKTRVGKSALDFTFDEVLHHGGAVGKIKIRIKNGSVFEGTIAGIDSETVKIDVGGSIIPISRDIIIRISKATSEAKESTEPEMFTYEELLHCAESIGEIQIRIKNGSIFNGTVTHIDSEMLRLKTESSVIPIYRDIIVQISKGAPETKEKKKPGGPLDTLFVVNPRTDEYGIHAPPLQVVGKIKSDDANGIIITTPNGSIKKIKRDRIMRVHRHTPVPYENMIKKYAKSLFCPKNMILVDIPPGKEGRPFFKVCIDKYEYPNQKGKKPHINIPYTGAQNLCKKEGKRLCTVQEWQWACSGLEEYTYPYGHRMDSDNCNREGAKHVEPSGSRINCVGKFGVYDMVGNVFEWVTSSSGKPMLMGGPYSKCQTISPGLKGAAKPQIGFRCCKSN